MQVHATHLGLRPSATAAPCRAPFRASCRAQPVLAASGHQDALPTASAAPSRRQMVNLGLSVAASVVLAPLLPLQPAAHAAPARQVAKSQLLYCITASNGTSRVVVKIWNAAALSLCLQGTNVTSRIVARAC